MAKQLVDITTGGSSGTKNDRLYTDAVTGRGVGISKTDYSRPRSGAPSLAELWQQQNEIKEANAKDRLREATSAAAAAGKAGSAYGILSGYVGLGSEQTKTPQTPQTPQTPTTSGGGGGGSKVTYIDAAGNAQKGTTAETPSETPAEPQRTYLDDMRDQYQKMYDEAVKANDAAAKAAAERAQAQVNEGIGSLGDSYGNLNKQLYRDYMESLRVLPQEMAARGYNGGMSESARLGLDTAYGERLNENEAARIAAEAELRQQAADAEYQANAARDQANAEAQQNLYANFMNLMIQQQNDAAQRAQNMAQYGDFSGYLDLGYTQDQIDQMRKAWIAANPAMAQALGYVAAPVYSSYGGGGGSGGGKTAASASDKLKGAIEGDIAEGKDRVAIWNELAEQYEAGNLTEQEFNDAIHYTDYAAVANAYGKQTSADGYKKWRNK